MKSMRKFYRQVLLNSTGEDVCNEGEEFNIPERIILPEPHDEKNLPVANSMESGESSEKNNKNNLDNNNQKSKDDNHGQGVKSSVLEHTGVDDVKNENDRLKLRLDEFAKEMGTDKKKKGGRLSIASLTSKFSLKVKKKKKKNVHNNEGRRRNLSSVRINTSSGGDNNKKKKKGNSSIIPIKPMMTMPKLSRKSFSVSFGNKKKERRESSSSSHGRKNSKNKKKRGNSKKKKVYKEKSKDEIGSEKFFLKNFENVDDDNDPYKLTEEWYIEKFFKKYSIFKRVKYEDLDLTKYLSSGGTGNVFYGKYLGQEIAFKAFGSFSIECFFEANKDSTIEREALIFSKVGKHPNICILHGIVMQPGKIGLVLDYCNLGSSIEFLKENTVCFEERVRIAYETAQGLSAMHENELMHRDIKPGNVLLTKDCTVKITDFGLSVMDQQRANMTKMIGTRIFMAVELFKGKTYTNKVDVYSFGIFCFSLMSGEYNPFKLRMEKSNVSFKDFQIKIVEDPNFRPDFHQIKKEFMQKWLKKLICKCWDYNEENRPTMKDILKVFEKNFINLKKDYIKMQIRENILLKQKKSQMERTVKIEFLKEVKEVILREKSICALKEKFQEVFKEKVHCGISGFSQDFFIENFSTKIKEKDLIKIKGGEKIIMIENEDYYIVGDKITIYLKTRDMDNERAEDQEIRNNSFESLKKVAEAWKNREVKEIYKIISNDEDMMHLNDEDVVVVDFKHDTNVKEKVVCEEENEKESNFSNIEEKKVEEKIVEERKDEKGKKEDEERKEEEEKKRKEEEEKATSKKFEQEIKKLKKELSSCKEKNKKLEEQNKKISTLERQNKINCEIIKTFADEKIKLMKTLNALETIKEESELRKTEQIKIIENLFKSEKKLKAEVQKYKKLLLSSTRCEKNTTTELTKI